MKTEESVPAILNEQQLLMLRLLKKPLPDASFHQIRQLAVKLLAEQLDETIDEWEHQNGITEDYYQKLGKEHFRSSFKNSR